MANITPIPISSLPVIDDPTGDELIPVSAQGSDGAVRLSDVGGGGIGDITQLPAAAVISGADLMLVNQSGDNKRATAAQLREYLEGDDKVTLIPSSSGTAYQIPYSTVDTAYTGTDKVTSYLLTEHCLTEAELRTLEPIVRGNTQPSMITFVSYAQLQSGQGASGTALTVGLNGTASLMIAGHSADPNNRKSLAIMYSVPNATNLYPAGTYINQEYVSSFTSIAYTPGGAKNDEDIIILDANNDFVLSDADQAMFKTHVEDGRFKVFVKTLSNEITEVPLTKLYEDYLGVKYLTATGVVCPPQTYDFLASVNINISNDSSHVTAQAYIIPIDNESTITIVRTANYSPSIKGYFFPYLLRNRYVWDTGIVGSNNYKIFDRSINQNTGLPDMTSHYEYTISSMNEQKTRIVMIRTQVQN